MGWARGLDRLDSLDKSGIEHTRPCGADDDVENKLNDAAKPVTASGSHAMSLSPTPDPTPAQKAVLDAVQAAVRPTFTGEVKVEVVAGRAVSIRAVKESDYPRS